jgi:hypothetical protein
MCVDAVEAGVRSLKDPSPAHIRAMVARLVDQRVHDGQLDHSGMTLNDLSVMKDRLVAVMSTVYHGRVAYPGQESARTEAAPAAPDARAADEGVAESG